MKRRNVRKGGFGAMKFFLINRNSLFAVLALCALSHAKSYYAAPDGTGDGSSPNKPFKTSSFWSIAQPGDTMCLLDGVYRGSGNLININPGPKGTAGAPIVIKAVNDGKVFFDGEGQRRPVYIAETAYLTVEGINAHNSSAEVVRLVGDHLILRRVCAWDCPLEGNVHVLTASGKHNLMEDCGSWGRGRKTYSLAGGNNVLRRCYGRWTAHNAVEGSGGACYTFYGFDSTLMENCVFTRATGSQATVGVDVWAHTYNYHANYNKVLGTVIFDVGGWSLANTSTRHRTEGNRFENVVILTPNLGYLQRADANAVLKNLTIVGAAQQSFSLSHPSLTDGVPADSNFEIRCDVSHSIIMDGTGFYVENHPTIKSFTSSYNDLYNISNDPYRGIATKGTGDVSVDPGFLVDKYGKGGYLFMPEDSPLKQAGKDGQQIGAEVLYRYENGVLTDDPLWPWPMEKRIFDLIGISVTWESHGGLWKTLDGVYSETPTSVIDDSHVAGERFFDVRLDLRGFIVTIRIRGENEVAALASIYNLKGEQVKHLTAASNGDDSFTWQTSLHAPGLYLVQVKLGNSIATWPVMVRR